MRLFPRPKSQIRQEPSVVKVLLSIIYTVVDILAYAAPLIAILHAFNDHNHFPNVHWASANLMMSH